MRTTFGLLDLNGFQHRQRRVSGTARALDIGTDLLPALALGGEKPSPDVLRKPSERRHLMDAPFLVRTFGVLGPVLALTEMAVFTWILLGAGWTWGAEPAPALLATASGAAFTVVVVGQMGTAVACRSATRPAWRINWRGNPMLLWALAAEAVLLVIFLYVPPLARALGHAPPPVEGVVGALAAIPAVLPADDIHKRIRHRRRRPARGVLAPGRWREQMQETRPSGIPEWAGSL